MTEEVILNGEKSPENGAEVAATIKSELNQTPTINGDNLDSSKNGEQLNGSLNDDQDWGIDLETLFHLSTKFFKENEGKAFHASYDNRNKLVALTMQAKHGPYSTDKIKPAASLDFVGKDRRQAWQDLGNLEKEQAVTKFASLLNEVCPLFRPFLEAHKREREERERLEREQEQRELDEIAAKEAEARRAEEEAARAEQEAKDRELQQKRQIQELLNRQTYTQFASYAAQQYPNSVEQQNILIRQLQEHHYQQYMQQMVQHQLRQQPTNVNSQASPGSGISAEMENLSLNGGNQPNYRSVDSNQVQVETQLTQNVKADLEQAVELNTKKQFNRTYENGESEDEEMVEEGTFAPAQMWTRKEIQLFKDAIVKEGGDGIIKVGHGEIVTVRVPTHPEGSCIFWEFATDSYDIGFGLLFEWTANPGHQVSVHVSESEDTDEEDEDEVAAADAAVGAGGGGEEDPEKALDAVKASFKDDGPPTSVIIPIYRRDSHEEVFAGSHPYPGRGVYLLKFDNSYSLWRSKSLYYRVYYTR